MNKKNTPNTRLLVVKGEKPLSAKKWKGNGGEDKRVWYLNTNCYNTDAVKWILAQERGADIFVFYQRLFELTVQLEKKELFFHEINAAFCDSQLFSSKFVEYAIFILVKVGLIEEVAKNVNGSEIMLVRLPDNDILRREI